MIDDGIAFAFGQPFFQATNDLARAHQRVGDRVFKDFSSCHASIEHIKHKRASRYILCDRLQGRLGGRGLSNVRPFHRYLGRTHRPLSSDDGAPPHNLRPGYNVCPTDPIDVVTEQDCKRDFVRMRWGLVPRWWSKPLKELRAATFNARAETVETKPFFRDAFKRARCLIPMSGYYEWQNTPSGKQPWYFTAADGSPALTAAGL